MNIRDIFKKNNKGELEELSSKVDALQNQITKGILNDSLVGIVGNNFVELETNKATKSYENQYTINRGINLLADNLSQLPLRIYRGDEPMPEDFILPGGFDLARPGPNMTLNELIFICSIYYFYRGEFMIFINLEKSPLTLEPVNPKLITRQNENMWKWNNKILIPNEQLIYTPLFNPDNDRGLSPVDVVKEELINDQGANQFAQKFFENYAQIGGKLYDELGLATKEDMKQMADFINNKNVGSKNAYTTLGLPKGIKYQQDIMTMKEMDFLSTRRDIRDRILAALGIHKAVFGVTDSVDRAVADAAMRQLWQQTLKPKSIRIQEKFNQSLMKQYFPGFRVKFDFSEVDVLQENRESQLKQAKMYRELGYTTNEINKLFNLGMEDVGDAVGDMRFVPTSLIPMENLLFEPEIEPPKAKPKSIDKIVAILEEDEIEIEKKSTFDKARRNFSQAHARVQGRVEAKMTRTLRKYFSEQLRDVTKVLYATTKSIDLNTLLSAIHNLIYGQKQKLMDVMRPEYEDGGTAADALALEVLSLKAEAAFSSEVIESMVNKISNINNHTYKLVRNQIIEGVAAGESVESLSKRIKSTFRDNVARSRVIARTESANLMNRQTNHRYVESNVKKKQWLSTADDKTRASHRRANSKGTVPYDHVYENGLRFPGDPNGTASEVVNCRCALIPVME